uniref:ATP synthase subunit a n=3 Tax=Antodynerus TaxID=2612822 RepID=A0A6M9AUM1_9HYME|nr:ATP synthase F0 subunit 6 [Antodynerus aff. limbatus YN]QKK69224.1 ATP synthase F0 subunit 6 [Antodynerus aff. limbatus GX]QKK69237.1 ATP synthase F0 subunit 6 [Antodynerus aff. limbatus XZ]QKK69250.1 ATP synthase F0 subunit 6 [Antodynerus aff. limbatus YN]
MLTNLFSIFDPNSSLNYSMNWMSIFISMLFFPNTFWFKKNKWSIFIKLIIMFLFNEMKNMMQKQNLNNIIFFLMLFFLFIMMNFMGLFPYIFTPTSHLTVTLPMSITIWMSIMLFGWINKTKFMFAHLVPVSTPSLLMPFMVIIETISNIIRPGTLAIRLSANMIAGHLLLCLLGSTGPTLSNNYILLIMILMQIMLFSLEMAVSIIQSYVFMTLSSLYSNET